MAEGVLQDRTLKRGVVILDDLDWGCVRAVYSVISDSATRREYWSGLPSPPPGTLPDPATEPNPHLLCLLHWQVGSFLLAPPGKPPEPVIDLL